MRDPAPPPRLGKDDLAAVDAIVAPSDERLSRLYPGDIGTRQPVHTAYVSADQVTADLTRKWGAAARQALTDHASTGISFAAALGLNERERDSLAVDGGWEALLAKLANEPIEDLRIDLEDGYGVRDDATEDADVVAAVRALADAIETESAPPFCGIRFKSMEAATRRRGLRTLDLALAAMLDRGPLPDGWVVTLPKVTALEQVHGMVAASQRLEAAYGLPERRLRFEVQIETPQSIMAADGTALVARIVHESDGRLTGLHFGTYDYTAALGVMAAQQALDHPVAEHAKHVMALATAGTGVRLSDGSSNLLPVGDSEAVRFAWREHARLVRGSLARGLYQGWDLHPAELVSRFAATYLFFRSDLSYLGARLAGYLQSRRGDHSGQHLDEPATAQALASFLVRGVHCGAVTESEVRRLTGASMVAVSGLAQRRVL